MFTLAQSRTAPKELIDFAKSEIQDVLMNVRSVVSGSVKMTP